MTRSLLVLLVLAALPCAGLAADAPASAESIRALFEITHPERSIQLARDQVGGSLDAGLKAGFGDAKFTPEQVALIDDFKLRLTSLMQAQLDWKDFEPAVSEAYARTFTQREIDAMLQFYRTPEGRSTLEKFPALAQATAQLMQARIRELAPRIGELQRELVAKLKASREKEAAGQP